MVRAWLGLGLWAALLLGAGQATLAEIPLARNAGPSPAGWARGYTLVLVDASSQAELASARDFIISQGGVVSIVLPPHSIMGWVDASIDSRIIGNKGIRSVHRETIEWLPREFRHRDTQLAVRIFNDAIAVRRAGINSATAVRAQQGPDRPPMVDCSLPHPEIDREELIRNLRAMGAWPSLEGLESSITPHYFDNSNVMDGSVAVAVFLVESNGTGDPNIYNWSQGDQDAAIAQVIDGLNWWVDQARAFNLARPLRFTVVPYYASNPASQQPYEPILHDGSEANLWVDRIMTNLAVPAGDIFVRVATFDRVLRDANRADWAFSIFIAYNPPPSHTSFRDGRASWAYLGGPYIQLLWRSFGWPLNQLVSHETGHIFYACDEYAQPGYQTCSCTCAPEIRPEATNGNCEELACNRDSTACVMRVNEFALCAFTVAQVGWTATVPRPIPTVPAALVATATGPTQVTLIWQDTASSEDGFQIERRGGSTADFSLVGTVGPNSTGYTDSAVLPNTAYAYRVRAFNATGVSSYTAEASVVTPSVAPVLSVATADMPDATVGVPYSRTLVAAGGAAPYLWVVDSGSLPAGLTMSQSGTIAGTPTTAGSSNFVVRVTDAGNNSATKALSLNVKPAAPLTITSTELPKGSVGNPYSQNLGASGGQTPYKWELISGALPDGLTLNQAGIVSGVPERAGSFSFVLRLTDVLGASVTATLSIQINPTSTQLAIETSSLPDAVVGQDYSQQLRATGGNSPYRWSLKEGRLPEGLTLSEGGAIAGKPLAQGEVQFQVQVSDQSGQAVTKQLSIDVDPAPQLTVLNNSSLAPGAVGVPYRIELKATGGAPPYNWIKKKKRKFGVLPDGISLLSEGALAGTPSAQGTFNFTLRVTDVEGKVASKPFTIEVGPPPPPLEVRSQTLPVATEGLSYSAKLEAGGGVAPYTWSIDLGALPGGLNLSEAGLISGRPVQTGSAAFTVRVRDAVGTSSTKSLYIIVNPPPPPLVIQTVQLPETTAERPYSHTLQATGGVPPYSWSIASGSLGQGMNLSADGIISGTPSQQGTLVFVVRVTDAAQVSASRTLAIIVKPADKVAPFGSLETPDYRATLNATASGTGWALDNVGVTKVEVVVDGVKVADAIYGIARPDIAVVWGHFPNGGSAGFSFTIDTTRLTNGEHTLAVRVLDAAGNVTILGARPVQVQNRVLQIVTTVVPRGRKGEPYAADLVAENGRPPYLWTLVSGSLPAGLSLSASGRISGTPTVFGTFTFGVRVTDSVGTPAVASFTLTILPDVEPLRVLSSGELTPGRTGIDYSHQLLFAGGRPPVTWSIATGSLPPGLSLTTTGELGGRIWGRPRQVGTFNFTARVTDTETTSAFSSQLTIVITLGPLGVVDTGNLSSGRTGVDYSYQLLGTGGTQPYTWAVEGGVLPPGLQLGASTGRISGRPTQPGSFAFTVRITDEDSASALSDTLRIVIDVGPLSITSSGDLAAGTVNTDYTHQLTLNGGAPPYTWSITSGALPAGLSLNASTGSISGRPTAAGTFTFTVQLRDSASQTASSAPLRITISP